MDGVGLVVETSLDVRTVARVLGEFRSLNPGVSFKYSRDEMLIRVGRIRGEIAATLGSSLPEGEMNQRTSSMFLRECVQVTERDKS
jgi:hypothetical protein